MSYRTKEEWLQAGVTIEPDVDPSRIAEDSVIHAGCRIMGAETSIGPGCIIGAEGPATIENCQLGRRVQLKGGFFSESTFLDGSNMGSGAHVRAGGVLEDEANGAHSVGLKQTVFLPFVTAGSLINFCDALMAGGTSRKNHSEIGSSYVHFNFTPHQDKATPSLLGDVPRGVFLNNDPIFLGGQGGLLGPARIAYGTVVAAGGVCRKSILQENQLHVPASPRSVTVDYETGVYRRIGQIVKNNLIYIGNIEALREWYAHVRSLFVRDGFDQAVLDGAIHNLNLIHTERIQRLGAVAAKMGESIRLLEAKSGAASTELELQKKFELIWPEMERELCCNAFGADATFIDSVRGAQTESYLETVQSLSAPTRETGRRWLQSIVDHAEHLWS
jgi:UDP-N-acetylglucosamine/UDP-N-acetylgalactosamine diphosphorylase